MDVTESSKPLGDSAAFAERILAILDEGSFTTTYKFALLLALLDACQEAVGPDGSVPERIPTRALAEHVVSSYWGHNRPYHAGDDSGRALPIRQSHRGRQTKIQKLIESLSARHDVVSPGEARLRRPDDWDRLVRKVECELIVHPIPRLQRVGGGKEDRVLYDHDFDPPGREPFRRHHPLTKREFEEHGMRPEIRLRAGVGEQLLRLRGLLRPVIQRHWVLEVQRMNAELGESSLEDFLFGPERTPTRELRKGLAEVAGGCCFYCGKELRRDWEVDHFVPWARHPDDGIHNLVAACRPCNNSKRALLAAQRHLEPWAARLEDGALRTTLDEVATEAGWEPNLPRTIAVARGQYLWLPGSARLWEQAPSRSRPAELVPPPDRETVLTLLGPGYEDRPEGLPYAAEAPRPPYGH